MVSAKNKLFSNEIETALTNVLSPVPKEAYEVVHVCSPINESKEYITIQWNEDEEERPENPIEIENLPMFTKFFQDSNLEEQVENKREDPDDLEPIWNKINVRKIILYSIISLRFSCNSFKLFTINEVKKLNKT